MDFAIFGLSATIVVKQFVNLLKKLGVTGKASLVAAIVTGVALGAIYELMQMFPEAEAYVRVVWTALVAGLGASELYEATRSSS